MKEKIKKIRKDLSEVQERVDEMKLLIMVIVVVFVFLIGIIIGLMILWV